ncbi:MAG: hypothetical protein IT376_08830 [Polyangiaceae bacterium]|nr:hypothetical protein [Polyangiaceae bacterium]
MRSWIGRAFAGALGIVCAMSAARGAAEVGAVASARARTPSGAARAPGAERRETPPRALSSTRDEPAGVDADPDAAREPIVLDERPEEPGLIAYPPRAGRQRGLAVFLHGMCDEPEWECPRVSDGVADHGWLVCPRAPLRCSGGGSIWPGDDRHVAAVDASVSRFDREVAPIDASAPRTLIGFSLGALRAAELVQRRRGGWQSAILIGAKVQLDARRLRAAGLERVVLMAGERDMMKWHMVGQARALARAGFPVAFVSLGPVGHTLPRVLPDAVRRSLLWAGGEDGALTPSTDRNSGELVAP